ncbi:MAG TPA: aminodeoxychorismate synthase component I [Trebonia sp.]|nr:aminodeoxychorismate synthase component I [Trebonia sp.]
MPDIRLVRRPLNWDLTPVQVLRLVRADPHPVALFGTWAGGCDIVGSRPRLVRSSASGPLDDVLDEALPATAVPDLGAGADPAFGGGWIGYLGYSAAGEALPPAGARRLPAWWFGWYDHVLRRDRATGEWFFEALCADGEAPEHENMEQRFEDLSRRAAAPSAGPGDFECGDFRLVPSPARHRAAVRAAVEYIGQGDIFQANICLRAEASFRGDPLDAFCQAAAALAPPYAAFLTTGGGAVASLSPELFLRRAGGAVESKPIKGTAPRDQADLDQADAQRAALERSAKNRAENVMIVDLVRNDLSRVCVPGSVTVPSLLGAEPHPGVWHLVSTVRGTLRSGATDGDLIRAAFPPGSVTGAPKVRALEVVDELEATPREVYTGAIGYRSPVAGLELNVAIRTFEFAAGRVWLGAGGGIVADSDDAAEYAECLTKATPLLTALGARLDTEAAGPAADLAPRPAAGVFTSLAVTDGRTRGLAAHTGRLAASVARLYAKDLPVSLPADLARCLAARPTGRLRITIRPVGGPLQATVEVVPLTAPPDAVALRPVTVSGGIGAHKYRDRRLLAELTRRARLAPGEQLLLTDDTGELLETDRANLFAVADGVLLTPPADGRLLPGTTRAAIIQAAHDRGIKVGFKPLTLDQLQAASEVFVTNAVAGVLPVTAVLPVAAGRIPAVDCRATSWAPGPVARRLAATPAARPLDPPFAPPAPHAMSATAQLADNSKKRPAKRPVKGAVKVSAGPLVILIDNYDSFTWNLAHLLDGAGCLVEVVRNDEVTAAQVAGAAPAGVVISPGPCAPAEAGISIDVVRSCAGVVPLLGICLGHQAIAAAFGAHIVKAPRPVHGQAFAVTHDGGGVLAGLPSPLQATRYHSLIVDERTLPADLVITARSGSLPMGLRHVSAPVEGVQFHPESILTTHGAALIRNFVLAVPG